MCTYVQVRGQAEVLFLRHSSPLVLGHRLSVARRSPDRLGWLALELQGPTCVLSAGVTRICTTIPSFQSFVLDLYTGVLYLYHSHPNSCVLSSLWSLQFLLRMYTYVCMCLYNLLSLFSVAHISVFRAGLSSYAGVLSRRQAVSLSQQSLMTLALHLWLRHWNDCPCWHGSCFDTMLVMFWQP